LDDSKYDIKNALNYIQNQTITTSVDLNQNMSLVNITQGGGMLIAESRSNSPSQDSDEEGGQETGYSGIQ